MIWSLLKLTILENNMKSYLSPKLEKRKSNIDKDGLGLFAKELIKKDEIVGVKAGHIITKEIFDSRGGFNSKLGIASLQIADKFFLGPVEEGEIENIMMFVNHSCEANIGFLGNIISVAMRDIEAGEELANDYAMWLNYPDFNLECLCGVRSCRGTITGLGWQNQELQQKYGKYFSSYLKEKI